MNVSAIDQSFLAQLPPVLKAVVKALGLERAKAFLTENGGMNVNIPKSRCNNALGLNQEELAAINKHLASHMDAVGRLWMPKVDKLFTWERNVQIRNDKENMSITELAKKYHLSSRHITNICRPVEQ